MVSSGNSEKVELFRDSPGLDGEDRKPGSGRSRRIQTLMNPETTSLVLGIFLTNSLNYWD